MMMVFLFLVCRAAAVFVDVVLFDSLFDALLGGSVAFFDLVEVGFKFVVLGIVDPMLCVKSQWQKFKRVLTQRLVIPPHIHE